MKLEDYIASGILEQYVMGELSATEEEEVLNYAERYPEVRREITMIEESLENMARSLSMKPPAYLLDQIQHKIAEKVVTEDAKSQKKKKLNVLRYGIAATFTLKLMFMAVAAHFWINWQHSESKLEVIQGRYDLLERQSHKLGQAFAIVNNPDVHPVVLKSKDASDQNASLMVYWNEASGEVYINTMSLPLNDENHQYQLWAIVKDKPLSLGVFDASPSSFPQMLQMGSIERITSFILTLEPEGGSSSPDVQSFYYTSEGGK